MIVATTLLSQELVCSVDAMVCDAFNLDSYGAINFFLFKVEERGGTSLILMMQNY